eukprot:TCALIF_09362-PA protein Name:"Protein of unknown function" AED:0.09 eAED:0.18 QI:0/1/0.5/1/1/1/2/117/163
MVWSSVASTVPGDSHPIQAPTPTPLSNHEGERFSFDIKLFDPIAIRLNFLFTKVFVALISVVALWSFSAALPAEEKFQSREIVDEVDPRIFELEYELTPLKSLKKREAEQASDLEAFNLDTEEPLKRTKRNAFFGSGINNNKKSYRLRRFRYQVGSYGQFPHH